MPLPRVHGLSPRVGEGLKPEDGQVSPRGAVRPGGLGYPLQAPGTEELHLIVRATGRVPKLGCYTGNGYEERNVTRIPPVISPRPHRNGEAQCF